MYRVRVGHVEGCVFVREPARMATSDDGGVVEPGHVIGPDTSPHHTIGNANDPADR